MPRKVTDEDVREMKSLREEGLTYREIAEEYNVSISTVSRYLKSMKEEPKTKKETPTEERKRKKVKSKKEKADATSTGIEELTEFKKEEKIELSDEVKKRINNFDRVGMTREEIATRLELPYSKVKNHLEEESLGIWDKIKRKLGIG